jgi:hypothetical protein
VQKPYCTVINSFVSIANDTDITLYGHINITQTIVIDLHTCHTNCTEQSEAGSHSAGTERFICLHLIEILTQWTSGIFMQVACIVY